MQTKKTFSFIVGVFLTLSFLSSFAQSVDPMIENGVQQLTQNYHQTISNNAALYKGIEYKHYDSKIDGYPFFMSQKIEEGDIKYDGILYKGVRLLYDINLQVLVLDHKNLAYPVIPDMRKISYVTLFDHHFINLTLDTIPRMQSGLYDLLEEGGINLYVRRSKSYKEEPKETYVKRWFESQEKYYFKKEGEYYKVNSKGMALKLMADKKKELKTFIKKNKLSFGQNFETSLKKLVEYYNNSF